MIVVVATAIGIVSATLSGGRLGRLARLELRHVWVIWLTVVVQTVIFELPSGHISETAYQLIHLGTYLTSFLFLWLNRHIPGAAIIGVGAACNALAITANGGVMPASPSAWRRAGLPSVPELQFENSNVVADAKFALLGDIFAIPAGWPFANVFSIGDVIIVLGGTYLAHVWCRRPAAPTRASTGRVATDVEVATDPDTGHPAAGDAASSEPASGGRRGVSGDVSSGAWADVSADVWSDRPIDEATMREAAAWLDAQLASMLHPQPT